MLDIKEFHVLYTPYLCLYLNVLIITYIPKRSFVHLLFRTMNKEGTGTNNRYFVVPAFWPPGLSNQGRGLVVPKCRHYNLSFSMLISYYIHMLTRF